MKTNSETTSCLCGKDARVVTDPKYNPVPKCERCGFVYIDGIWKGICAMCKKEVKGLYGFFVPHLCTQCCDAEAERQRKSGQVCGLCRNVYLYCAC